MLAFALLSILAAAPPRQPVLAYWVSHHDLPPALDRPWGEGFTNPRLVAYDDGLVIYAPDPMKGPSAVTLSASELSALLEASGSGFFELQDSYTGTKEMHPPVHLLTRWKGGTRKTVRFFGRTSEASDAPQTLLRAIEKLAAFSHPKAVPWSPEEIVVRTCRTTAPPEKKAWPSSWPKPEQGRAPGSLDGCFEHLIAGKERARAESLLSRGKGLAVVPEGGQTWLVTFPRFALPSEEAWAGR
ncbi:MAG: hypothetical protein U1E65_04855 [Myxococcota bacterium]